MDPGKTKGEKTDVAGMLQRIETKVSTLMDEIKEIRKMVENKVNPGKELPVPDPEIELDFETWYNRHGRSEKQSTGDKS